MLNSYRTKLRNEYINMSSCCYKMVQKNTVGIWSNARMVALADWLKHYSRLQRKPIQYKLAICLASYIVSSVNVSHVAPLLFTNLAETGKTAQSNKGRTVLCLRRNTLSNENKLNETNSSASFVDHPYSHLNSRLCVYLSQNVSCLHCFESLTRCIIKFLQPMLLISSRVLPSLSQPPFAERRQPEFYCRASPPLLFAK